MIQKLVFVAKDRHIPGSVITDVVNAPNNEEADKKIREFYESKPIKGLSQVHQKDNDGNDIISDVEDVLDDPKKKYDEINKEITTHVQSTSQACSIL